MFDSTLLPQTNEPQEIQKAVLDLLDKINQVSSSSGSNSIVSALTTSQIVPSGQKYIPVTSDAPITLTLQNTYALYDEIEIQRIPTSNTNITTIAFTGETINGDRTFTMYGNPQKAIIRKITNTTWALVFISPTVYAEYYNNDVVTGADIAINWSTKQYDPYNCVVTGAGANVWRFTAPFDGEYDVKFMANYSSPNNYFIWKNNAQLKWVGVNQVANLMNSLSTTVYLLKGEYINVRGSIGNTGQALSRIHITKIGD